MNDTTKQWLQANKRKVSAPRKRKTSNPERTSPTKSVASAPSPERRVISPERKSTRSSSKIKNKIGKLLDRAASEQPNKQVETKSKTRRSRNVSILGTTAFDLSPLPEINESNQSSKHRIVEKGSRIEH